MLSAKLSRLFIGILAILVVSGCEKAKEAVKGRGGGRSGPAAVKTVVVTTKPLPRKIDAVSILKGRKQAEVYSRVAGKVASTGPAEGTKVKAGDVLVRIDRSDPGESFLATPIISPISGWVGRWMVSSIGEQVTAQEPVVIIVDDEVLHAAVMLPTTEWLQVTNETPVKVRVAQEVRAGKVTRISRAAEAASGRGAVHIEVENHDHRWKAGMVAGISLDLDTKPRIVIPATALAITDKGAFVFVAQDDKAKRLPVNFVVIDNDQVEIIDGLAEGSQLITEGVSQVGDASPIKIVETPKEP